MFNTESQRTRMWFATAILSLLAAVLAVWATEGFLSFVLLGVGFLLNVAAVGALPHVDDHFNADSLGMALLIGGILTAVFGCMLFGWWGLAYAVACEVVLIVSSVLRG